MYITCDQARFCFVSHTNFQKEGRRMYMTEFIVIATRYIFLSNYFCIVSYGGLCSKNSSELMSQFHRPSSKPDATTPWLNTSRKILFFHSYECASCVDYTTSSLIKNLCAYLLILFYVTTTLKTSFYSGKHTDFENENKTPLSLSTSLLSSLPWMDNYSTFIKVEAQCMHPISPLWSTVYLGKLNFLSMTDFSLGNLRTRNFIVWGFDMFSLPRSRFQFSVGH